MELGSQRNSQKQYIYSFSSVIKDNEFEEILQKNEIVLKDQGKTTKWLFEFYASEGTLPLGYIINRELEALRGHSGWLLESSNHTCERPSLFYYIPCGE